MDAPTRYEIRIEGQLSASWSSWFADLEVRPSGSAETVLAGMLPDQTALHGVLMRIRDLGLPLIAVRRVEGTIDGGTGDQIAEEEGV